MNEPIRQEVAKLENEVQQDAERLKAKKKALRKLKAALEQLNLPL